MKSETWSQKINSYNKSLHFAGNLPPSIRIMNPFKEENTFAISTAFYNKYYNDNDPRFLILGINPGRFGAGLTGIPFTDPKRLQSVCNIPFPGKPAHEPSSDFIYQMIEAFGGAEKFYHKFFINSVSPLGFTSARENGKEINYNYYDSRELTEAIYDFAVDHIKKLLSMSVEKSICICFGTGKNEKFIRTLNNEHHFFKEIIALEHPRFIKQYKAKSKDVYIQKYLEAFERCTPQPPKGGASSK